MSNDIPKIRKIRRWPKVRPASSLKWAVFHLKTHFRLTEYATKGSARLACMHILEDRPDLKDKIDIKQRNFEVK